MESSSRDRSLLPLNIAIITLRFLRKLLLGVVFMLIVLLIILWIVLMLHHQSNSLHHVSRVVNEVSVRGHDSLAILTTWPLSLTIIIATIIIMLLRYSIIVSILVLRLISFGALILSVCLRHSLIEQVLVKAMRPILLKFVQIIACLVLISDVQVKPLSLRETIRRRRLLILTKHS